LQVSDNSINSLDSVLDYKQKKKLAKKTRRLKKRIKLLLVFLFIGGLISIYFFTSLSNVKTIKISGNYYLSDSEILSMTDIDLSSKYLLVNDRKIATNLKENTFIEDATVSKSGFGNILLNIKEKKIAGYVYSDATELYFTDGTFTALSDDKLSLISNGPLFIDLSSDMVQKTAIAFNDVDIGVIRQMSEVSLHIETYDSEMLQILMSNDKYLFTSLKSTSVLNSYFDLSKYLTDSDKCIYIDELSGHAY